MLCSKIGGECPHPVAQDDNFVFVMMPFTGFDNIYDAIQLAVQGIPGKNFKCERADEQYSHLPIWCERICKNIRKAKYLVVDTTGRNANVFYELGFSHALDSTRAILITQNIKDAPFDIVDLNHIVYSPDNLKDLREKLQKAIGTLEEKEEEVGYTRKSSEGLIRELKSELRSEENRASNFKKELIETEKREADLKQRIKKIEAIQKNPVEEAKSRIAGLEGTIAELRSKLKLTEESNKEDISRLECALKEKEVKLETLEEEFAAYKESKDDKSLLAFLIDDVKQFTKAEKWFFKAKLEKQNRNIGKAISYYSKAIELNPEYLSAYNNRGNTYIDLKEYVKALADYSRAIELNPDYATAYNNRGLVYRNLGEYTKAITDYDRAIELKPDYATAYSNRAIAYQHLKEYSKAIADCNQAIEKSRGDGILYNNRGTVYFRLKEYDKAMADYVRAIELNSENVIVYNNLMELYIIIGDYEKVLGIAKKSSRLFLEKKDRTVCLYLECIAKKLLDKDVSQSEKEFEKNLKEDFTTTWESEEIESWLEDADIPADKKEYIIEKTKALKKHKK